MHVADPTRATYVVLVPPTFDAAQVDKAAGILREHMPYVNVVVLNASAVVRFPPEVTSDSQLA